MTRRAVIAGAGPAGLTCALYLARAGWNVDVFSDEENTESCLSEAEMVRNYPGFPDGIGGFDLLCLFRQQAEDAGAIMHPEGIERIYADDKAVIDTHGALYAYDECVEAVGCHHREYSCEGIGLVPVHYCAICDGGLYGRDDTVVVVGGGDTAVSSALYLSGIVGKVVVLVRKPHCRCTNLAALDELQSRENVEMMYETTLGRIDMDSEGNPLLHLSKNGDFVDHMLIGVKGMFVCIGHDVNSIERVGDGKVWRCGDCAEEYKQVAVAVGSGAKTALEIIGA